MIELGPQEWFFNELKAIRAMELHYLDERTVKDNPSVLVDDLRKRGPKDCLIGEITITKWEPELIQKYTKMLVANKANYMLLSHAEDIQKCCTKTEPYFGTEYNVKGKLVELIPSYRYLCTYSKHNLVTLTDIPLKIMEKWMSVKPLPDFCFFKQNPFVTTNNCLVSKEASYSVSACLQINSTCINIILRSLSLIRLIKSRFQKILILVLRRRNQSRCGIS